VSLKLWPEHFFRLTVKMNVIIRCAIGILMLVFGASYAQITSSSSVPGTNLPPFVIVETNLFPVVSNSTPVLDLRARAGSHLPAPGNYLTKPYTCMVKVPGPHLDDCRLPGTTNATPILTSKPTLEFVPLSSAGK
jgi:hypothetical protein